MATGARTRGAAAAPATTKPVATPVPTPPSSPPKQLQSLRQQFDSLSTQQQVLAASLTGLGLFLTGFFFGWTRRKSAEERAAAAAAQTDVFLQLNRNVSESKIALVNQSWQAEKSALLARHTADKAALETALEKQEKQAAKRLHETRQQLEAALGVVREKEAVLQSVWGSTEALENSVVSALGREVAVLRAAQRADARITMPARLEAAAPDLAPGSPMPSRPRPSQSFNSTVAATP